MPRIGEGGPLVHMPGGGHSLIPSKEEIIKDLIKWFATEYGLDIAEKLWEPLPYDKLIDIWKKKKAERGGTSSSSTSGKGGGGGGALVLIALLLFGGKRKR